MLKIITILTHISDSKNFEKKILNKFIHKLI